MDIIKQLKWRYATKSFDSEKKISEEDFNELLEVTRLSPSSYGLQAWKALIVKNSEIRGKLKEAAYGQSQITDASHLVIFSTPKIINEKSVDEFIKLVSETRSVSVESLDGYKKSIMGAVDRRSPNEIGDWAAKQTYIALGFLLEAAALKNVDSCPMEGFDSKKFDEILGLDKSGYESRVICALGYRSNKDAYAKLEKVRTSKEKLFEEVN